MLEQLLFLLLLCLFVCFLAVVNIVTKTNLGKKGFLFQHSDCGSTMLEPRARAQAGKLGQELKQRHGGGLLTGLLSYFSWTV